MRLHGIPPRPCLPLAASPSPTVADGEMGPGGEAQARRTQTAARSGRSGWLSAISTGAGR